MRSAARCAILTIARYSLSACVLLTFAAPANRATTMLETMSHVTASVLAQPFSELIGSGPGKIQSAGAGTTPDGGAWNAAAIAETLLDNRPNTVPGWKRPTANASAVSNSTAVPVGENNVLTGPPGTSSATARLTYQVRIIELLEPPVEAFVIPTNVTVGATVQAELIGGGIPSNNAFAAGWANIGGYRTPTASAFASVGSPLGQDDFFLSFGFDYPVNAVVQLELYSEVGTRAAAGSDAATVKASATAIVDPVFAFDQQAFDEFAGRKGSQRSI